MLRRVTQLVLTQYKAGNQIIIIVIIIIIIIIARVMNTWAEIRLL